LALSSTTVPGRFVHEQAKGLERDAILPQVSDLFRAMKELAEF
jgi:hypothetical protein